MNFIARIIILSCGLGLLGSIVGGLSFFAVVLLFGGITAAAIVLLTPPNNNEKDKKEHTPHYKPHYKKGEYQPLPMTVMVDPSRSKENSSSVKEHFVNGGSSMNSVQPYSTGDVSEPYGRVEVDATPYSGPSFPDYTPPTAKNLFMNVLLDEYKYNPDRPEAAPVGNSTVKQTLDDFFRVHWYSDPTDVFGKNQNQRQFVTQPSTTVPNDQGSFADWLYKIPGKTCKEGGRAACLAGTDGGLMPWLSQAS
jgi:hypothetical protein